MESPIVKEEKIDIKQGLLDLPSSDRLWPTIKKWKQRYFVFCQIRKGENNWLKLFYYKSHSSHKEGEVAKGLIDITTASDIGIMDKDIDGHGHIIYISTPGKTFHLSALSCEERSQWLLALRAYKYNDKSMLPSLMERAQSWNGWNGNQVQQDKRKLSEPPSGLILRASERRHKLREMYPVCSKCQDRFVPQETYQWLRPEHSDIYNEIHRPLPENKNTRRSIYEEPHSQVGETLSCPSITSPERGGERIQYQIEESIIARSPLPLPKPFGEKQKGTLQSAPSNRPESNSGINPKPHFLTPDSETAFASANCNDEKGNSTSPSTCSRSSEEYIDMNGKKDEDGSVPKRLQMPYKKGSGQLGYCPIFYKSPRGSLLSNTSFSSSFDDVFLGEEGCHEEKIHAKTSTPHRAVEDNRYIPEPIVRGDARSKRDSKDHNLTCETSVPHDALQNRLSSSIELYNVRDKRQSLPIQWSKFLQSKFGVEGPFFVADV